jgi:UDP-glucose 4-epimerase
MRYLITGGCGFIGSHLAHALIDSGHQVVILDDLSTGDRAHAPAGAELLMGDITCADTVTRAVADVGGCFHLAAIASIERCHHAWRASHDVNLGGTITVLDACRNHAGGPIPVVFASSSAVYGDQTTMPLSEISVPQILSTYGADKLGCEIHARVAAQIFALPTVGLRLFNVYGPRQQPDSPYAGVIAAFGRRILAGEPLTIFGDGEQMRDFVYVGDAVGCFMAAMEHASGMHGADVLNVCSGKAISVNRLVTLLATIAGRTPIVCHHPGRAGDIRTSLGDPSRCAATLGVTPTTDLAAGLRETLDWLEVCGP